jgi:glycosyltransferase involved in cell wall biosynthesis
VNILYTNFHFKAGGGHTTYILSLLDNPAHTAFVACAPQSRLYQTLRERGFERLIPIEFYTKVKDFGLVVKNTRLLKKAIEEHALDIVHTNGSPDNRMALYVSWFSRHKFRIAFTKHNSRPVTGLFARYRLRKVNDAVIFVSEAAKRAAGFPEAFPRFHVVENGIDLNHWKRSTPPGDGSGKIRLVSTAGCARTKGWIHLAEALALLSAEERARFSAVVVGRNERSQAAMQTRARELCGMEFPGYCNDPRAWLEDGDIAFLLSYSEASSFAQREMMAMGLPLIVSDCPSLVSNVDPSCGWVTKRRDAESVAGALREILALPAEKLREMQAAARRKAEEQFDIADTIARTNKIYAALAPEPGQLDKRL